MATLTEISILTRKIIRFTIIGIIGLIFLRIFWGMGRNIYLYFFPPPPPPPTVTFGKLPKIPFPQGKSAGDLSFSLETPEGGLPVFFSQATVYFMPKPSPTLSSLELAGVKAFDMGFVSVPEEISQTLYRFRQKDNPATLEYDIASNTFSISYDLAQDSSILERIPPPPEVAASTIRSYLSSSDLLPEDLSGLTSHEFLKIQEGNLVPALSQSDADLIKVHLFRKEFDELPTVTARPDDANVWFMISGDRERLRQVVAAEFHYFPVDGEQSSTYPIKTTEEAWSELQSGNAYIAKLGSSSNVVIRRIYLAHYDPSIPSEFFQPVYVFEGDGFTAYIPAVTLDYYGE